MTAASGTCATPIAWDELVAYWAGELDGSDLDRLDEHLMGCPTCTAESARVSAVTEAVRALIPPVIDHARLESLRATGRPMRDNVVHPDDRRSVVFEAATDFLIHRLRFDLSRAERVEVRVSVESTGAVLLVEPHAPFDRDSGEVLIACQRHFAAMPPDIVIEVRAHDAAGIESIARYPIPHVYQRRAGE
ncbi:MAG: hypothetical protein JWO86_3231 [Myxococcaceae bacterium]|nr:hypothetical protein [Myxococcaceae bacterium]MEA2748446.1 hypothetical protein [Myxococcales bacterium]